MIRETRDKKELAAFFKTDPALYAYLLGDLDDFFFPKTTWWVAGEREIRAALLVYSAFDIAVIMALADNDEQGALWEQLLERLPGHALVHYRGRHEGIMERRYRLDRLGPHHRMKWDRETPRPAASTLLGRVRFLTGDDLPRLRAFYESAYPSAHFDPRMLDAGKVTGISEGGDLLAVATCHVFSKEYSVATFGAIATRPGHRGKGYGAAVTEALLRRVADEVDCVGLNVHSGNAAALRIYERLGFRPCHDYHEAIVQGHP